MTTFSIPIDSISSFNNFITKSKVSKDSKSVFIISENSFNIYLESSIFAIKFNIPVTNISLGNITSFSCDNLQFVQTLMKLIRDSTSLTVEVDGEDSSTKTTIINPDNGAKISLVNYVKQSDKDVENISNAFDLVVASQFSDEKYELHPDLEFMSVMAPICRSMNASGNEVNAAVINRKIIKYCDPQGIIEYTLENEVSPYDKDIYIQSDLVDNIKPFAKEGVKVILNATNQCALIESLDGRFHMALGLDNNRFQYPTEEEMDYVLPDQSNCVKILFKKDSMMESIRYFDNLFKADWKYNNIEFDSSKVLLSQNKVRLNHGDYNASVDTSFNVTVLENTLQGDDCKFLIGSAYLMDMLRLIGESEVTMCYSPIPIGEFHGTGFTVEGRKIKVTCIKILKES